MYSTPERSSSATWPAEGLAPGLAGGLAEGLADGLTSGLAGGLTAVWLAQYHCRCGQPRRGSGPCVQGLGSGGGGGGHEAYTGSSGQDRLPDSPRLDTSSLRHVRVPLLRRQPCVLNAQFSVPALVPMITAGLAPSRQQEKHIASTQSTVLASWSSQWHVNHLWVERARGMALQVRA